MLLLWSSGEVRSLYATEGKILQQLVTGMNLAFAVDMHYSGTSE